jgi:lipoprotein-anchoring transpeptidase ErfK/SrfK
MPATVDYPLPERERVACEESSVFTPPFQVALRWADTNIRPSQMFPKNLVQLLAAVAVLGFFAGCEELDHAQQMATSAVKAVVVPPGPTGFWHDNEGEGSPKIVVHLGEQKAYFYKGKVIVGETTVSTGKPGFGTPPGHYHVVSKDRNHVSSEFGDYVDDDGTVVKSNVDARKDRKPPGSHFQGAKMPFCMHFNGGYAMHQGYVPRFAASHGCIRIPPGMAEHFFDAAHEGTPITVKD